MNKLEFEMRKRNLEYRKEICENMIRINKNGLVSNGLIAFVGVITAISLIVLGVLCLKNGECIYVVVDFVFAVIDIGLAVTTVSRMGIIKRSLERDKAELEGYNDEITKLGEIVL